MAILIKLNLFQQFMISVIMNVLYNLFLMLKVFYTYHTHFSKEDLFIYMHLTCKNAIKIFISSRQRENSL